MEVLYEKILPGFDQSFRVRCFDEETEDDNAYGPFHAHPELEVILIQKGAGKRLVGDRLCNFQDNDLVLVGNNLPHYYVNEKRCPGDIQIQTMLIQFNRDFMGHDFFSLPEAENLNQLFDLASQGLAFSEKTAQEIIPAIYELKNSEGLTRLVGFMKILDKLCHSDMQTLASAGYSMPDMTHLQQQRIEKAILYIVERFDTPLSLEELSGHCHMSTSAFSRLFTKSIGKSYKAFLTEVRIGHASKLLIQTDLSVVDIALSSGFMNLSNFNRRFLDKMKLTPRDYRKQIQRDSLAK